MEDFEFSESSPSRVPGRARYHLGRWLRETVSTIINEVSEAILDDDSEPPPSSGSFRVVRAISTLESASVVDPSCSSDVINLLSTDSTYLADPLPHEKDEFDTYQVAPSKVRDLLRQFPSLQMRIDHFKMTAMNDEGEKILKRILFKIDKLQTQECAEDDLVVVSRASSVLVESDADFVPLSD